MEPNVSDPWATGHAYEAFMGRWSRMLARRFIEWLDVPGNTHWLDVGCGTGALASALCRDADPASVHACDPAAALLEHARHTNADPRVTFVVAGTGSLPPRPGGYGSVTSLLALNFFPDVAAALREQRSLAGSGGVVSACVWDYAGGMQFLRRFWDAVTAGDPSAADLDEGVRFPICAPPMLTDHFDEAGLRDVTCAAIDVPTRFASFEDYWRPFLGGTGPAPSYVDALSPSERAALADRVQADLPKDPDGSIPLLARAWVVRGTAP